MKLSNIKAKANKEKQILVIHVLKCALLSLDIIQQKQTFLPPFLKKHTQHSLSYFSFAQTISTAVFSCSISLALLLFHISLLLFYIYTHTYICNFSFTLYNFPTQFKAATESPDCTESVCVRA